MEPSHYAPELWLHVTICGVKSKNDKLVGKGLDVCSPHNWQGTGVWFLLWPPLVVSRRGTGHTEEMIVPLIYPEGDFPVTPWGKATFYGVCQSATITNQKAWITIK